MPTSFEREPCLYCKPPHYNVINGACGSCRHDLAHGGFMARSRMELIAELRKKLEDEEAEHMRVIVATRNLAAERSAQWLAALTELTSMARELNDRAPAGQAMYARALELCRLTPGRCWCGIHISEVMGAKQ